MEIYIYIFPFNLLFSIDSSLLLVSPGGNSFDFWQDWGEDWEGGSELLLADISPSPLPSDSSVFGVLSFN